MHVILDKTSAPPSSLFSSCYNGLPASATSDNPCWVWRHCYRGIVAVLLKAGEDATDDRRRCYDYDWPCGVWRRCYHGVVAMLLKAGEDATTGDQPCCKSKRQTDVSGVATLRRRLRLLSDDATILQTFCYNSFFDFATAPQCFCYKDSGKSLQRSWFCQNSVFFLLQPLYSFAIIVQTFCYNVSGEVSGEIQFVRSFLR